MNNKRGREMAALGACVIVLLVVSLRPSPAPPEPVASATPSAPATPAIERVTALYARQSIAPLTAFTSLDKIKDYFILRSGVPAQFLPPTGFAVSYAQLLQHVSLVQIDRNEPILMQRFARIDELARASSRIPEGRRAITVPVESLHAAGGFIKQGDVVDVMAEYQNDSLRAIRPVLSAAEVFAVNTELEAVRNVTTTAAQPESNALRAANISQVTFAVTPPDAERLSMAAESGRLYMLLRSRSEPEAQAPQSMDFDAVLNDAHGSAAVPKRAIELIQGNARQEVLVVPSPAARD